MFQTAAHIPLYLYPFLNTTSKSRPFEYLRLTSLGVIGALVKVIFILSFARIFSCSSIFFKIHQCHITIYVLGITESMRSKPVISTIWESEDATYGYLCPDMWDIEHVEITFYNSCLELHVLKCNIYHVHLMVFVLLHYRWQIFFTVISLQVDDTEVISFLLSTEIIPLCLRTMEMGSELSKTVDCFLKSFLFSCKWILYWSYNHNIVIIFFRLPKEKDNYDVHLYSAHDRYPFF